MPETITITVYAFDELSERAKSAALDAHRTISVEDDWWDAVYEDAVRMGAILGIEIGERVRRQGTKTEIRETDIYFQCNSAQGDRATYAGVYNYRPDAVEKIKDEAPQDEELLRIAQELQVAQVTGALNYGTQFRAAINHMSGHAMNMSVETYVVDGSTEVEDYMDVHKEIERALRDFADWIHKQLADEQCYFMSDEAVAEMLTANEFRFDEDGARV